MLIKWAVVSTAWALGLVASGVPASAQAEQKPVYPRCGEAEYHQFDFWIGDWDSFDAQAKGAPAEARAHITPIAQGCAIHELYEQNDGLIGDSILSYDPVRKQWQQTWVTNRGSIMQIYGAFKNGAVELAGDVHLHDGGTVQQKITWRVEGNGVRESSVLSKDGGKTWEPAFDVLFRKHIAQY